VIDVVTAKSAEQRTTIMTTFTIDEQNSITAFASHEEAAATTTTPFDSFASQQDLAELIAGWPTERLLAVWNSLPGVTPAKKFKDHKGAASRIWERIQDLGEAAKPETEPSKPTADEKAKGRAKVREGHAGESQGEQEGHPRQESAQGESGRQGAGSCRPPRGQ
jgi:hypothetical protein